MWILDGTDNIEKKVRNGELGSGNVTFDDTNFSQM